ncbi:MAG: sulfatase [Verrucomicrobiales bacterium]|nr:sulfatase [Verrucomicrobiales bacterium]
MHLHRLRLPLLTLGAALALAAPSPAAAPRDVLFIAVDDLNDWTGHLKGHPQARTPNIDRLVARGVTFTNAHCAAPACNPSRAALMSGLRPWQTGIYTNGDPAAPVLKDVTTINRYFLANGYNTLGGGKIYHGFPSEGRNDSWTQWVGLFPTGGKNVHNLNGLDRDHFDWGPLTISSAEMGDSKLTDWAIDQLHTAPADQPLFLAVGYVKPHLPWYVPQEYFDRFPLDEIQLPKVKPDDLSDIPAAGVAMAKPEGDHAAVVAAGQWKNAVQAYLATISFLDDQVGRLLDAVEASPRGREMIVFWWTDHGWHLGEKEHWRKFALWEDATHTSFGITVPGVSKIGGRCEASVDYTSIYPTLCEAAGLPVPSHVTGPSLMPLLKDPDATWEHPAVCTHGRGNHAAIDGRYRYIRYSDGSEELYDHQSDPNEWTNLAGEVGVSEIKQRLSSVMPAADTEVPSTSGEKKAKEKGSNKTPQTGSGQGKGKNKGKGQGKNAKKTQAN